MNLSVAISVQGLRKLPHLARGPSQSHLSLIVVTLSQTMSLEGQQGEMASLWQSGRALSPWSQAKVWALKEVWPELHPDTTHGRNTWIASKVFMSLA